MKNFAKMFLKSANISFGWLPLDPSLPLKTMGARLLEQRNQAVLVGGVLFVEFLEVSPAFPGIDVRLSQLECVEYAPVII